MANPSSKIGAAVNGNEPLLQRWTEGSCPIAIPHPSTGVSSHRRLARLVSKQPACEGPVATSRWAIRPRLPKSNKEYVLINLRGLPILCGQHVACSPTPGSGDTRQGTIWSPRMREFPAFCLIILQSALLLSVPAASHAQEATPIPAPGGIGAYFTEDVPRLPPVGQDPAVPPFVNPGTLMPDQAEGAGARVQCRQALGTTIPHPVSAWGCRAWMDRGAEGRFGTQQSGFPVPRSRAKMRNGGLSGRICR